MVNLRAKIFHLYYIQTLFETDFFICKFSLFFSILKFLKKVLEQINWNLNSSEYKYMERFFELANHTPWSRESRIICISKKHKQLKFLFYIKIADNDVNEYIGWENIIKTNRPVFQDHRVSKLSCTWRIN